MRIIFMGTPDFAVPTLEAILQEGYQVVGVVTATDKWMGRGKKRLHESPVKKVALEHGLPIFQPNNLKSQDFINTLTELKADIQVVVAFRMLPKVVWDMPPMGTYNLHGSLLPAYRGAAPIHWAVARGETYTGMSTFKLRHEIDTGNIAFQDVCFIPDEATTLEVHDRMMHTGASLMVKTIRAIEDDTIVFQGQDESLASHAPKVFHDQCQLDFAHSRDELLHFVHGMSPFPGAWMIFNDKQLKILRAHPIDEDIKISQPKPTGSLIKNMEGLPVLCCKDGFLELKKVQPEGKPKMNGRAFANGYL